MMNVATPPIIVAINNSTKTNLLLFFVPPYIKSTLYNPISDSVPKTRKSNRIIIFYLSSP
ncbi:hypothetical protein MKX79_18485 [Viridibacillus sp. FSL R5-0468]|uniref:hypothetical protein n=1 Tax=Viridibacillus sp. FSL R5-0468 TaxID=2921640 RepID=UPI0004B3B8D0